jgi:hypothetical protein
MDYNYEVILHIPHSHKHCLQLQANRYILSCHRTRHLSPSQVIGWQYRNQSFDTAYGTFSLAEEGLYNWLYGTVLATPMSKVAFHLA